MNGHHTLMDLVPCFLFVGEDLYVMDGSTNNNQVPFLKIAVRRLCVVVVVTNSNIRQLEAKWHSLMLSIADSRSLLAKADNYEFIVRFEHKDDEVLRRTYEMKSIIYLFMDDAKFHLYISENDPFNVHFNLCRFYKFRT
jgi:hypothetical protein